MYCNSTQVPCKYILKVLSVSVKYWVGLKEGASVVCAGWGLAGQPQSHLYSRTSLSPGRPTFRNAQMPCLAPGLVWLMCFSVELVKGSEVRYFRSESNFKSTNKNQENEDSCFTLEMSMCEQASISIVWALICGGKAGYLSSLAWQHPSRGTGSCYLHISVDSPLVKQAAVVILLSVL